MIQRMIDDSDMASSGPRNQTSMAYEIIRSDILTGRHKPGKKLKIQELSEELGISPGAVREALSRLVPEELVISRDQRGFLVAPLSPVDLADLTDLRCEIESIALRRSVELGDVDWEAGIIAAEHKLNSKQVVSEGVDPLKLWAEKHAQLHLALVSACGSRRLLSLHSLLYQQSERYRGLLFHIESERDVQEEHREIVQFALARNAPALVDAMVSHLRATTDLIIEGFGQRQLEESCD